MLAGQAAEHAGPDRVSVPDQARLLCRRVMIVEIEIKQMLVDGSDVLTWLDLHTSVASPTPTANWMNVVDGRIARIRVTFDPCGILAGR